MLGGHCEVSFADVDVPATAVLGEIDQGFRYAQVRLGPARMTHVMRWLGAAQRGHDIAVDHVTSRDAFGTRLGQLGMVQKMLADNVIDIAATQALLVRACWELDRGDDASESTSITKTFAAEAIHRVIDRSIQMCGALGVSAPLGHSQPDRAFSCEVSTRVDRPMTASALNTAAWRDSSKTTMYTLRASLRSSRSAVDVRI
jgi:acyl-CoA dehydrogenase